MSAVFLDSSALVKLVRPEHETDALHAFLDAPRRALVISELAVTEVTRAARRVDLDPQPVLAECDVILLDSEAFARAAMLDPPSLRTLDAIQLASALSIANDVDAFVAYDERLLAAAEQHGLTPASPGR